jgi:hypothetical protein
MFRLVSCARVRLAAALATLTVLLAVASAPLGTPAQAAERSPASGVVRAWNAHAVDALMNPPTAPVPGAGQAPHVGALHLAMVQGAVYDAVNSIDRRHTPYLPGLPPAPRWASQDAAVATAAHHVLVGLGIAPVPPLPQPVRDRLDALYADALAAIPDGRAEDAGIAAGAAAAAAMLAARTGDGRYEAFAFGVGADPGEWRTTPPGFVSDPFAWVAGVDPFVLRSPSQFRSRGPHRLASRAYAREYAEVRDLGAVDSARSPAQDAVARFYTVNAVELFNRAFRTEAQARGLTVAAEARLFAMLGLAEADALINCWSDKAFFAFWRPITAIHEGDRDGNRRTVGDATWTPLVTTPPYPEHPSGYNCISGAMMQAGRAFFGTDRVALTIVRIAPGTPDVTRDYRRLGDVVEDTIDARIYQGIHFRAAEVQGARMGRDVARWVVGQEFRRVR